MKIIAINSSPRKARGNTQRVLSPFLEGAREAGAETEIIYLADKTIKPCRGCYNCWLKTPGVCVIKDDAADIFRAIRESDIVVYATPLYVFGMSALMKLLLDRIMPEALPAIELLDGHTSHPPRHEGPVTKTILLSNCGFYEQDNFDDLVAHFKTMVRHQRGVFMGALLRTEGEFLPYAEKLMPEKTEAIYQAAREAGRQAVKRDTIE
ncbi:MAG TPA: flavodoxin family protein, partial [Spirochaetes bacterium]|nr:flavodoxin family protein [Spirochaetota bacterium]